MIDVRLVNDGRRLMNSKEKRTVCFLVILTFDRIIKRMNDIRTFKSIGWDQQIHIYNEVYIGTSRNDLYTYTHLNGNHS